MRGLIGVPCLLQSMTSFDGLTGVDALPTAPCLVSATLIDEDPIRSDLAVCLDDDAIERQPLRIDDRPWNEGLFPAVGAIGHELGLHRDPR